MKLTLFIILVLSLAGCQANEPPSDNTEISEQALSAHGSVDEPLAAVQTNLIVGTVKERLDADRYSYLRLSIPSGEIWAAVLKAEVQVGDVVSVVNPMPMDGFESKTLNRTFEQIVFGTLSDGDDAQKIIMDAHAGVSETPNIGPIEVGKALGPDGRTVAEIFARKQDLNGRMVAVRGRVTKVNAKILDRNWIHIQDGSGGPEANNNDLVVTSQTSPSVGDTVLIEGILRMNKNYGMGYVFPVIVEDAKVIKE